MLEGRLGRNMTRDGVRKRCCDNERSNVAGIVLGIDRCIL